MAGCFGRCGRRGLQANLNYKSLLSSCVKDEPSVYIVFIADLFGVMLENNNISSMCYNQEKEGIYF